MNLRTKLLIGGAVVVVAASAAGGGIAVAGGSDDTGSTAITDPAALHRATTVALAEVGGGRVSGTEAGDEESYYQVEVTRPDRSHVDVQLDRSFRVVGSKVDLERG